MADILHNGVWNVAGRLIHTVNRFSFLNQKNDRIVIRFNTSADTDNLGDFIIMHYCGNILKELYKDVDFVDIPTHTLPTTEQEELVKNTKYKFVCGTNLLTSKIEKHWNWILPDGLRRKLNYRNVILLGVGWKNYEDECSEYSKMIYRSMLNPYVIHSVRDSYTEQMLKNAGIQNVVNTGCPTMWNLTPEFCRSIPMKKALDVVTTITDYRRNIESDNLMLKILGRNYRTVYLWIQGRKDEEYLSQLEIPCNLIVIPRSLEAYEEHLNQGNLDYVGTRLHAGIFALNHKVRSLIIAVDNRAIEIAKDTRLPVILRKDISNELDTLVNMEFRTEIQIHQDNITTFKKQFIQRKNDVKKQK